MKNKNTDPGMMGISPNVIEKLPELNWDDTYQLIEQLFNNIYKGDIPKDSLINEHWAKSRYTTCYFDFFPDFFISSNVFHLLLNHVTHICSTYQIRYIEQTDQSGIDFCGPGTNLEFVIPGITNLPFSEPSQREQGSGDFPEYSSLFVHVVKIPRKEMYDNWIDCIINKSSSHERKLLEHAWGPISEWKLDSSYYFFSCCWENWWDSNPEFSNTVDKIVKDRFMDFGCEVKKSSDFKYKCKMIDILESMNEDGYSSSEIRSLFDQIVISRIHDH